MSLFYGTILTVATFLWGFIFYKKEYHPQPLRVIFVSILGGGLAMLPVLAYRYVYQNYLPLLSEIELIQALFHSPLLSGLIFFLFSMAMIVTFLTLFAGVISLILTRFRQETLQNIRATMKDDEFEYVTMSMMIALLIYGERMIEKLSGLQIINSAIGAIFFLAIIEEYVKHLVVRFIDDKKIKDIDDAITLSIVVGLSFALVETLIYGITVGDMRLVLPRVLLSVPVHLIASGIFGYYYGLARFAEPILESNQQKRRYTIRFKWIHTVLRLKKSEIYEEEKTAQGLVLATVFHTISNILFQMHLAYITVPLIVLGLAVISYFYKESRRLHLVFHKDNDN